MKIRLLALASLLALTQCKKEELPAPRPALVVRTPDVFLPAEEATYPIDLDSNGFVDFNLLVHGGAATNKLIYRLQGVISSPYTTVIHGTLRELEDDVQCDLSTLSVLEPTIFRAGDSIGAHLPLQWYLVGDFHYDQSCTGTACPCTGASSSVQYLPLNPGESAYVGLRFIIRRRKHYGWLEIRRNDAYTYTVTRMAYNRFSGQPALIVP